MIYRIAAAAWKNARNSTWLHRISVQLLYVATYSTKIFNIKGYLAAKIWKTLRKPCLPMNHTFLQFHILKGVGRGTAAG